MDKAHLGKFHAGAFLIYAGISFAFLDHGMGLTKAVGGAGDDPLQFVWFMAWWPWAILHHLNPLCTKIMWYPLGSVLPWATSVPLLALLGMPVTLLSGPDLTYNLWMLATPVLAAWMSCLLCLRLSGDFAAALIGGYLFGFSSYTLSEGLGGLNLAFTCCVPALLLVILARLDDDLGRRQTVALTSLLLICQFLISAEIFAMIFFFGGISWGLAWLYLPGRRPALYRLFADGIIAALPVTLILSPFLFVMFSHYGYVHLPELWPRYFTADLLNIFVPARTNAFSFLFGPLPGRFGLVPQELDAYLGVPLLAILWFFHRREGKTPSGRYLILLLLVFLVLSFGPGLWVGGHYTGIGLPWELMLRVPLLGSALPCRFALFVSLTAAIMASIWIAAPGNRGWRIALGVLACFALMPAFRSWEKLPDLPFFEPGHVQRVLGPNPKILILPFGINGPSTYWQAENHFGFTETGGYLGFPPAAMQKYPAVGELFGNFMGPHFLPDFVSFCHATRTQFVVIGPGAKPEIVAAVESLDWTSRKIDDVTVLTVPSS